MRKFNRIHEAAFVQCSGLLKEIAAIAVVILTVCVAIAADRQTFFISPDQPLREPPADEATIPLCTVQDTTQVAAYAGAVWGEYDLSAREDCTAWCVASSAQLDSFLTANNYRRMPAQDAP